MRPTLDQSVIRQEQVSRAALQALHVSSRGATTTVFTDQHGRAYVPTRRPTAWEIMFRPPRAVHTVHTAEQHVQYELDLPAEEKALKFHASVALTWRIADAVEAVTCGLERPESVYRPVVDDRLRRIARTVSIESSDEAEEQLNDAFPVPEWMAGIVEVIRCTVQVSLDTRAEAHVAARVEARWKLETRRQQSEHTKQDMSLQLDESSLAEQLTRNSDAFRRERERAEAEHAQQLLAERMQVYSTAMAGGLQNLIALKLADNNDDVDEVINLIMQSQRLDFDSARGMLTAIVEKELVSKSQIEGIVARINSVVANHLSGPPLGLPARESPEGRTPLRSSPAQEWQTQPDLSDRHRRAQQEAEAEDAEDQPDDGLDRP
jgi:hypothetical protein